MKPKHLYLIMAIAGAVTPWYFAIPFFLAHGLDARAFMQQLFGTPIAAAFAADLLLSCVVFVIYFRREAARVGIERRWPYVVALVTVGLSFAFPLFLFARESRLEAAGETR
jgi:hypothetical protein